MKLQPPALVPEIDMALPVRRVGVFWSGLRIADLITEIKPIGKDDLQMKASIRSYGIAKLITEYKSDTTTRVKREGEHYQPLDVSIWFHMRYGDRDIAIAYNEDGTLKSRKNEPAENPGKRPPVPKEKLKGALDPLSAALEARRRVIGIMAAEDKPGDYQNGQKVYIGMKEKAFVLPMYDGRRFSNLNFTVHGLDEKGDVHLTLIEDPVTGWTNNELKEKKKRNPVIHVYLDQADYLPVRAVGESRVGTSNGVLNAKCATIKECD